MSNENLKEKLEKFETTHISSLLRIGDDKTNQYLAWDEDKFKAASRDELKGWLYSMTRYAVHLSDLQAFHYSRFIAIQRRMDFIYGISLYPIREADKYLTFEERKLKALGESADLRVLHDSLTEHEMYSNRLNKVSYSINDLIKRVEATIGKN